MKRFAFAFSVFFLAFAISCSRENSSKKTVLKIFTNLPDRKFGQGALEQEIIDRYMAEHSNIEIVVEALDETSYKTKFKAYCQEKLPDIVSIWGSRAFLEDAVDAGLLLELNKDDYADYNFLSGSLKNFTFNGVLYGLPRNVDMAVFYYNERMFYDHHWSLPKNWDEFLKLSDEINTHAIAPVSMDGGDGWPLMMFVSDILYSLCGNEYLTVINNALLNHDFSDARIKKSLDYFCEACNRGLFQNGFESDDYAKSQGLFLSGKSAMYYMGTWETSMAVNTNYWNAVTKNLHIITLPSIPGEAKKGGDVFGWYGGGYAVSSKSAHVKEALDFFNYLFLPQNISKLGLEKAVGVSAQNESEFLNQDDPLLLKQVVNLAKSASSYSGPILNDLGNPHFKRICEENIQRLASGRITVDEFIHTLEKESAF